MTNSKFVLVVSLTIKLAICMETMYMARSGIEDQASSASAYSYQIQSGVPLPLQYQNPTIDHYNQELQPKLADGANYVLHPQPISLLPLNHGGYALVPAHSLDAASGGEEAKSSDFEKGGGSAYNEATNSANGEKSSSGYESKHSYDKGAKGEHDKAHHSGHYNKEGASKIAHHDEGGHYGGKHEESKGAHGESFSQKSSKKKGSKTTGYHRVHHKDEYKKDHSFYDESDSSGNYEKYGNHHAKHAGEQGGYEKGEKLDSGYKAQEYGEKGEEDKGKYLQEDSGYKGAQGQDSHFKNVAQYAKKGGQDEGKQYGYSEEHGLQKLIK